MVHACCIYDYHLSVQDTILRDEIMYVNVYIHLLKESKILGALERVQKSFSAAEHPWLFVACAASVLAKEKDFFLIEADVSPLSHISLNF